MRNFKKPRSIDQFGLRPIILVGLLATGVGELRAQTAAVDPAATDILKRMTECVSELKEFGVDTQCTLEELLETGSRVDFDVSARTTIRRPNKIRAERRGEVIDQRFFYDGKTLTLFNPTDKVYATVPAPNSLEGTTPQPAPATATMNVPNSNGSYTPVQLKQVPGGWQGPKGEIYPSFPTVDELKKVYGM